MSFLARSLNLIKFTGSVHTALRTLTRSCHSAQIVAPKQIPLLGVQSIASKQWIYRQEPHIENPLLENVIQLPNGLFWVPPFEDLDENNQAIKAPGSDIATEKEAARLIVIRRKKMKKHKLRKLRKRMKFEWAKVRQRRELKKEKQFQAGLIAKCKEAEAFDAEKYVEERLGKLNEVIIPKYWRGRRLPEFIIREKMGLPPKSRAN